MPVSLRRELVALLTGGRNRKITPNLGIDGYARETGDPFKKSPWFDEAEPAMEWQLREIILPFLTRYESQIDYSSVMDFAAGHGRNTAWLKERVGHILIVDINQSSIDFCRQRFKDDSHVSYLRNDGVSLKGVESNSVTFLYSFDSVVHFDSDVVRAYMKEFRRVLGKGGHSFVHHSNYTANPDGDFRENPHLRNFMSKELFAHGLAKEGLEVIEQQVIDWELPCLDCITLFRKVE